MEESLKKMRLKRKHIYNQKEIVGRSGKHYEEKMFGKFKTYMSLRPWSLYVQLLIFCSEKINIQQIIPLNIYTFFSYCKNVYITY